MSFQKYDYLNCDEMPEEEWRPIEGYKGSYEVSSHGRVRSLDRIVQRAGYSATVAGKMMTPSPDKDGYLTVGLTKDGVQRTLKLHRLVAQSFLIKKPHKTEVDHLDGRRDSNRACNLAWVTRRENIQRAINDGKYDAAKVPSRLRRLSEEDVASIQEGRQQGRTMRQLVVEFGFTHRTIKRALAA